MVTLGLSGVSQLLPNETGATLVGLGFLFATYLLVWRRGSARQIASCGLSLGGLFDPEPLDARRMLRATARAGGWALLLSLICFPPFLVGFHLWYQPSQAFSHAGLDLVLREAPGQLLMVALPEEAFYRGYVQSGLDRSWPPRITILKGRVGWALLVTSALFALGHLLSLFYLGRLAVFFPALLFGWLRARTGGIGASVVFHACCNLFASYLGQSYGLY